VSYISKGTSYGLFEKQAITPDGVKDTFALNYKPGQSGAILVVYSGVIQEPVRSYNLIDGGKKIRFSFVPDAGETLYVLYLGRELSVPSAIGNYPVHESAIGDDINTSFTLPVTPAEPALMVYVDGVLKHHGTDWSLNGNQVIFTDTPVVGAKIDFYVHGVERTDLVTVDNASVTAEKLNLTYVPYSPAIVTFNGMSRLDPQFVVSKYMPLGNYAKIRLLFKTTFGDTPDNRVRFTLPSGFNNDGTGLVAGTVTISTESTVELGILKWGGVNSIDIRKASGANFAVGEEYTFEIVMDYDLV
jgi:hypothetical protein